MTSTADSRRMRGENGRYLSKCTDEVTQKVCLGIRAGCSLETAAQFAEVDESTLTRWKQRVRDGEATPAECKFVAAVRQAIAEFKVTIAARITAPDTPKHVLLEYLGRRFPQEFGPVARVNIGGHDGEALQIEHEHKHTIDLSVYTDDELKELDRLTRKGIDLAGSKNSEVLQLPAR